MLLVRGFMTHGHLLADLDPLHLISTYRHMGQYAEKFRLPHDERIKGLLDYRTYGFTEEDLDR